MYTLKQQPERPHIYKRKANKVFLMPKSSRAPLYEIVKFWELNLIMQEYDYLGAPYFVKFQQWELNANVYMGHYFNMLASAN